MTKTCLERPLVVKLVCEFVIDWCALVYFDHRNLVKGQVFDVQLDCKVDHSDLIKSDNRNFDDQIVIFIPILTRQYPWLSSWFIYLESIDVLWSILTIEIWLMVKFSMFNLIAKLITQIWSKVINWIWVDKWPDQTVILIPYFTREYP